MPEQPPDDTIPPGYSITSPRQKELIRDVTTAVAEALIGTIPAVALVFSMPDGSITAAIAGDASNVDAFAKLLASGPDVLRTTVARMLAGKGETRVVALGDKGEPDA